MVTAQIIHYNAAGHELFDQATRVRNDHSAAVFDNPNFISGIHNYCDRWCERCPLTSRCAVYAAEQADPDLDDPEVRDITNEKFWRKLQDIFRSTAEMVHAWAEEAGVDLNAVNVDEEMAEHDRAMEEAEQNELSQAAQRYATAVQLWFRTTFGDESEADAATPEVDPAVNDAASVVRWYQFFIAVKLMRALSGTSGIDENEFEDEEVLSFDFIDNPGEDDDDVDLDEVMARSSVIDANGSAKIALVAIDRSMAAWSSLQISLPESAEGVKPMLIELEGLRRGVEARFPRARDFIRPGFDENLSEFVS